MFEGNRYFDVVTEYAKHSPSDILIRITVHNRGPETADLHVLPQLWFRNTWSWGYPVRKPELTLDGDVAVARSELLGAYRLYRDGDAPWLFTENETNGRRLFGLPDQAGHFKDAFHEFVVDRNSSAINPQRRGTKAAAHYHLEVPAGGRAVVRLRLSADTHVDPFAGFDSLIERRRREADDFYDRLQTGAVRRSAARPAAGAGRDDLEQAVLLLRRAAVAEGRSRPADAASRNANADAITSGCHLNNADIISMPDKWEYPWYAAWDLAFHTMSLALVDPEFAKTAAGPAHARVVHAPERPAAGVRVGVWRRQPAGARVGDLARVSDGSQTAPADNGKTTRATSRFSSACSTS